MGAVGSLTAAEVRAALHGRWPNDRYLHIEEAPLNHYRQGNKIDVLIMDQWQSGKHQTEAVEVKVSYSDWCKEWRDTKWVVTDHMGRTHEHSRKPTGWALEQYTNSRWDRYRARDADPIPDDFVPTVESVNVVYVGKNRSWREHAHRFWIAAPLDLAQRIRDDCDGHGEMADWGVLAVAGDSSQVLRKPATTTPKVWPAGMWLGIVRSAADAGPAALQRARDVGSREGYKRGYAAAELDQINQSA